MPVSTILKNATQRCGIELEMYVESKDSYTGGRNLPSIRTTNEYLTNQKIKGFTSEADLSLRKYEHVQGVEVKFSRPTMLKSSIKKINDMCKMVSDLDASFMETEGKYIGDPKFADKIVQNDGNYNGSTGLHVHFEVPTEFMATDFIRLINFHAQNYETICKLAWRKDNTRWAPSAQAHINSLSYNLIESNYVHIDSLGKYAGLNLSNLRNFNRKRTVEFRYGHASLALDKNAFIKYVEYLKDSWDKCFTGEPTAKLGDLFIEDVTNNLSEKRKTLNVTAGALNVTKYLSFSNA